MPGNLTGVGQVEMSLLKNADSTALSPEIWVQLCQREPRNLHFKQNGQVVLMQVVQPIDLLTCCLVLRKGTSPVEAAGT